MKYLVIDTSKRLMVSFVENETVLFFYESDGDKFLSERIMPTIEDGFNKTGWRSEDLNKIFVTNGPGSFTGIRVGLTIAKTMGFSLKIPVITLSSLEMMASGYENEVYPVIADRNGYVYAGGYDKYLNSIMDDCYVQISSIEVNKFFVSYDQLDIRINVPKVNIIKVINKHKNDVVANVHALKPNYLKMTDAEKSLNND